jgi:hypothetical protein
VGFGERKAGKDRSKGKSRSLRDDNKKSKCNGNGKDNGNGDGDGESRFLHCAPHDETVRRFGRNDDLFGFVERVYKSKRKDNRRSFDCVAHKVREQLRSG